jgi:hypothetical protein
MLFLELFITFFQIGLFGFGGGYAMLSMIQGEVVIRQNWITASEFTDIVAISQMTPGPIGINSATYVGYTSAINAGYSPKSASAQASQILKDSEVQEYLKQKENEISKELRQEFIFDALEARKVMYDIMNNPEAEDRDRIAVAKDFLDRAGFKPTDEVKLSGELNNPFEGLTTEELKKLVANE